jgi:hypothetical protein
VLVWDARPLTSERRTEIDATSLLATLAPQSTGEADLVERIGKMSLVDDAVRTQALSRASDVWRSRVQAKSQETWYWLDRLWPKKLE